MLMDRWSVLFYHLYLYCVFILCWVLCLEIAGTCDTRQIAIGTDYGNIILKTSSTKTISSPMHLQKNTIELYISRKHNQAQSEEMYRG